MAGQVIDFAGGARRFALASGPAAIDQLLWSSEIYNDIAYHNPNEFATTASVVSGRVIMWWR